MDHSLISKWLMWNTGKSRKQIMPIILVDKEMLTFFIPTNNEREYLD